jgi:lipid-A-disaccharide synthase
MRSTVDSKTDKILIIAAEASSCMYAKMFMDKWSVLHPHTEYFGIGDKEMSSKSMHCLGFAEDLAVVGLQEVIAHFPEIKKTFNNILDEAKKEKPKFALLLDYPGFNLRLAKRLKAMDIHVVYYISPQLWAWKKGRVEQVKKYVDDMMVVFPFEVDFYKQHSVKAHFVGHPLVEIVEQEKLDLKTQVHNKTVLGIMPGSRKSEIKFNFIEQLKAAQLLIKKYPMDVKILVAPTLNIELLKEKAGDLALGFDFIQDKPTLMINQCDLILTASGTATLQVALCEKPMVVMYKMNSITAFLARCLVNTVDYFCIVNLIAKNKIVPEVFQNKANFKNLALELEKILTDKFYKNNMLKELNRVKELLGKGGATDNLVNYLNEKYL